MAKHRYRSSTPAAPKRPASSAMALKDEVGFNNRNLLGHTVADAYAEQAAVCDAEDGLDQLIARVGGVGKGVKPRIDANLNIG